MDALVACQRGGAREGFTTVRAQIGLFTSMRALMVLQIFQLCVRFTTLLTGVRTMPLMVSAVLSENRWVCETLPTLCTEIGLLSRVGAHVHLEFG